MDLVSNHNGTKNKRELFILLACLVLGFALRFYTFDQKSLWLDEIHTFNESRDDVKGQLRYYREHSTHLQPPLFFVLSHLFYPFAKPERDLRIIPLIFGTLSIPMIYFLSRMFSPVIALPCALSLTFMAYHVSLSQEGRAYSLLMFLGLIGLYFFMHYLKTLRVGYLFLVAFCFAIMVLTSYSAIPFIAFCQILWFYQVKDDLKKPPYSSIVLMNLLILLFSLPWLLFVLLNYPAHHLVDPYEPQFSITFWSVFYGMFHDWAPHLPLTIASVILLALFPFVSNNKKNSLLLLAVFVLPIAWIYFFCRVFGISHFITSRYLVSFLPLFLIALYLSLEVFVNRFEMLNRFIRLRFVFILLFILSNIVILPFYYVSEKQDLRGLVLYLKQNIRQGDKIYLGGVFFFPGLFHYFGIYPEGRHYDLTTYKDAEKGIEYAMMPLVYQDKTIPIYYSRACCSQYVADGGRLWIVIGGKQSAKEINKNLSAAFKGYFDGSFLNFNRFPTDASIYLFLWDPRSPNEKGIPFPIQ